MNHLNFQANKQPRVLKIQNNLYYDDKSCKIAAMILYANSQKNDQILLTHLLIRYKIT